MTALVNCRRCDAPARPGFKSCEPCAEYFREQSKQRVRRPHVRVVVRKQRGPSPRPLKPGKVSRQALDQRALRAAGLCVICREPSAEYTRCADCRAKSKARRQKRQNTFLTIS